MSHHLVKVNDIPLMSGTDLPRPHNERPRRANTDPRIPARASACRHVLGIRFEELVKRVKGSRIA